VTDAIRTDSFFPHPPEKVRRALTDPGLRISWAGGGLDTTVTWDLVPEGRGTRLLLSHEGFDGGDPAQQATMRILGGGWTGHLARRLEHTLASQP
jgi:uncharacterized protein YndB with AHSA1/START domain